MNYFLSIFAVLVLFSCSSESASNTNEVEDSKQTTIQEKNTDSYAKLPSDTTLKIGKHLIDIKSPKSGKIIGDVLVLPGWNFSRNDWCKNSKLCEKFLAKGYRLILPEMGKSVYSTEIYPETRKDWLKYPTKPWLTDTVFPELQKTYGILKKDGKNFVLGLSTGARGVALMCLAKPKLFKAAAALSGDYDQTKMPGDNLMRGFYGEYGLHKDRWEGEDNVVFNIKKFKTPIYLGHGTNDKVCPPNQTKLFYDTLKVIHPKLLVKLNMPEAKHDYDYWDSEVNNMLGFFQKATNSQE